MHRSLPQSGKQRTQAEIPGLLPFPPRMRAWFPMAMAFSHGESCLSCTSETLPGTRKRCAGTGQALSCTGQALRGMGKAFRGSAPDIPGAGKALCSIVRTFHHGPESFRGMRKAFRTLGFGSPGNARSFLRNGNAFPVPGILMPDAGKPPSTASGKHGALRWCGGHAREGTGIMPDVPPRIRETRGVSSSFHRRFRRAGDCRGHAWLAVLISDPCTFAAAQA